MKRARRGDFLRNEMIHDAAPNSSNEQVASHLRYYLTFMLNEIITYMSAGGENKRRSIEQYFLMNEIKLGNIEQKGYPLKDFLQLDMSASPKTGPVKSRMFGLI